MFSCSGSLSGSKGHVEGKTIASVRRDLAEAQVSIRVVIEVLRITVLVVFVTDDKQVVPDESDAGLPHHALPVQCTGRQRIHNAQLAQFDEVRFCRGIDLYLSLLAPEGPASARSR